MPTRWIQPWMRATLMASLLVFAPLFARSEAADATKTVVLAAASLTDALQEIARSYEMSSGKSVSLSFASSMTLAKQIEASAGADLFLSADKESMDYLDAKGLVQRQTRTDLLRNDLVLIAPSASSRALTIAPGFKLGDALQGGRLALADTQSVPAGRYGKEALTALGVWDSVKDHLAQGEDVRATLAFVARGEAPFGIVYATDAKVEARVKVVGTFPENSHEPIVYPAALVKDAKPDAAAFLVYLKGPQARATFERAGFRLAASQP